MQPKIATARLLIGALVLAASLGAGVASAQTTGETTHDDRGRPTRHSRARSRRPRPRRRRLRRRATEAPRSSKHRAGRPRLLLEETTPSKIYWRSGERAKFRYEFAGGGGGRRDLVIKLYKTRRRQAAQALAAATTSSRRTEHTVRWGGSPGVSGTYKFRVSLEGGRRLDRSNAKGDPSFRSYTHKFPVRGGHTYGDGYGAGRGHRGQDVFADCGTTLVAARAGRRAVQGLPGQRCRLLRRDRRQGHQQGLRLHAPPRRRRTSARATTSRPARSSARSASPATPAAATSTSSSGRATGTAAATRWPAVTRHLKRWDRWG